MIIMDKGHTDLELNSKDVSIQIISTLPNQEAEVYWEETKPDDSVNLYAKLSIYIIFR